MLLILHTTETAPGTFSDEFLADAAEAGIIVMFGTEAMSFAELWDRCGDHATGYDGQDVLVITDLPETILACDSLTFPVWGYEHDDLRLSCDEIVESVEDLTLSYLLERYAYTTGNLPVYSHDDLSLYAVDEDEYVNLYKLYQAETYFLTAVQRAYTENDARELYRFHKTIASFRPGLGTYRVCPEGCPDDAVAYVSAYEETIDDTARTTIDFYVLSDSRGMGFGRRSVSLLLHYLRNKLSEDSEAETSSLIHALVHSENEASVRTLESLGFRASAEPLSSILIYTYDLSEIR